MALHDEAHDIGQERRQRRAQRDAARGADELAGRKPVGARPGTRVTQASRVNPNRWPRAGENAKAELTVWFGPMRKRTFTVAMGEVERKLEQAARNHQRAVARAQMSGDLIGESRKIRSRPGKPERWAAVSSVGRTGGR
jgi:hypothetical protein